MFNNKSEPRYVKRIKYDHDPDIGSENKKYDLRRIKSGLSQWT